MTSPPDNWRRFMFKTNKVWVATDANGQPAVDKGKVLIKYQLDQSHEYRVHAGSIRPIDASDAPAATSRKAMSNEKRRRTKAATGPPEKPNADLPEGSIRIYTDGASSGNPGPAGVGVLMLYGSHQKEISSYIGEATNNVAELEAIRIGLQAVRNKQLPVRVFTDSNYAYGLLALGWKARKNQRLLADIKTLMNDFADIRIYKVKGHAGVAENERADRLATGAIKKGTRTI